MSNHPAQRGDYRECIQHKQSTSDIIGYAPVLDETGHFPIDAENFTLSTSFGSDRTADTNLDLSTMEAPVTSTEYRMSSPPGSTTFCLHHDRHNIIYEPTLNGKLYQPSF